ncbi:alpha/beta hydrolase [Humitalea sp. 24SJ18S-53]|uniref:alpha/beta hydrolase n=1 Tax=Humitalea sp. 24SJ18S-53 TaxID=3422307 RepID=UPI003D67C4F2
MSAAITRHFVTVGGRRIHYRRVGEGPALAMLHASPRSATELRPNQEVFAGRFTTLAFDTPGFGLSDLLPLAQPETEDLADALAETLDALGVGQVAVYGRHTGASVAVEFAARHGNRCAMALTNGFPIYSKAQQQDRLTRYLNPIVPSFAGEHLLWLWYRFRDQHVFWPWHEHDLAHRANAEVPDLATLHRGVMEFLEAGDNYRIGYATAFRHRGLDALPDLKVPVCFGNRRSDSIFKTMSLYPPEAWTQEMPAETLAAARAELAVLLRHPAKGEVPAPPPTNAIAGRTTLDFVAVDGVQVLTRSMGDLSAGNVLMLLHRLPGSSALYDEMITTLGARRPVLALDLPGHGESDAPPEATASIEAAAGWVLRVLDALNLGTVSLYGHQGGASVAIEVALRQPQRVHALALDAPVALPAVPREQIGARWLEGVAPLTPVWNGDHLLRAWHMRRDMELWFPWNDRRPATARKHAPRIDPAALTLELREVMKQPESFAPAWRAVWSYPTRERLALTTQPCLLLANSSDVFAPWIDEAAAVRPDARLFRDADPTEALRDF